MNLLENINRVLKPYAVQNQLLTDAQTQEIIKKIEDSNDPKTIIDSISLSYVFVKKCLLTRRKGNFYNASDKYLASSPKANRFNHVAETFALGVLLGDFHGLKQKIIDLFPNMYFGFDNYWLIIALLHDYGYYNLEVNLETIMESIVKIGTEDIEIELEGNYHHFYEKIRKTYSEEEIYNYFNYIKEQPRFDKYDHGIVGGINGYTKLVESWKDAVNETDISFQKFIENGEVIEVKEKEEHITFLNYTKYDIHAYRQICYAIMQHNMFKPKENKKTRNLYDKYNLKQLSNKSILAEDKDPLYMLLSLVDTIEYLKVFCSFEKHETKRTMKHRPSNIGEKIIIDVSYDKIIIDYRKLYYYLERYHKKEIESDLDQWIEGIMGLSLWVKVTTEKDDKRIIIKIDDFLKHKNIINNLHYK